MDKQKNLLKSKNGRDIQMVVNRTGLKLPDFSICYDIPLRTLQDWIAGKRPIKKYVLDLLDFKVNADVKKRYGTKKKSGVFMSYYTYSYSEFEPIGQKHFGSLELALDDAKDAALSVRNDSMEIYVSLVHDTPLRWETDATEIIEEIEENLGEDCGCSNVYELVTKEDISALDFMLNECINKWITDRHIGYRNNLVSWTKRYVFDESTNCYEFAEEV